MKEEGVSNNASVSQSATAQPRSNAMLKIKVSKVVVNIGTGNDEQKQSNALLLLQKLTGAKPASAISRRRLPEFKIAKGQKIGAFVSLRGAAATEVLKRLFSAVDNKLSRKQVVDNAVNFGIKEYIDVDGLKYDPKLGMMGMNVNISFARRGARVAARKRLRSIESKRHRLVPREEIIPFLYENFNVSVE
ncbi:MAG: 50S ribosomal protein L5 [Candidatus Micrarchaeaceae archaeon]